MQPTQSQLNYALRRIIYNTLLATNAIVVLRTKKHAYPDVESYKILSLLMARTLNEFFADAPPKKRYRHDIRVAAFGLPWDFKCDKRFENVRFDQNTSDRVSRIVAHVVMTRQPVFRRNETFDLVTPLVELAVEFVTKCRQHDRARYTGSCHKYVPKLNQALARLGMSLVPIE